MLQHHLVEGDFQFFGEQHRHRRIDALPHLHGWHDEDNFAVGRNANEGVWFKPGCGSRMKATAASRMTRPAPVSDAPIRKWRRETERLTLS